MKKKIVALLISACTVFALTGCAEKEISNKYITIPKYKGIEIEEVEKTEVTDEEVEESISSSLEVNSKTVNRKAKKGDQVIIDFLGKKDGVAFEGGAAEDYALQIGAGGFIPGFEEGIIGHKPGETFDVDVTFPENYGNEELAGQPAVFTMTLKEIHEPEVLNDEFVKANSKKATTVEEYRKEVRKNLEEANEISRKETIKELAWAKVVEGAKVKEYPKKQVEKYRDMLSEQYGNLAEYSGMELEEYVESSLGMSMDDFNAEVEKAAKEAVKDELAVDLMAKKLKIKLSEDDYKAAYKKMAKDYGFEDIKALKEQVGEEELRRIVLRNEVVEWVGKNCIQVEASK